MKEIHFILKDENTQIILKHSMHNGCMQSCKNAVKYYQCEVLIIYSDTGKSAHCTLNLVFNQK